MMGRKDEKGKRHSPSVIQHSKVFHLIQISPIPGEAVQRTTDGGLTAVCGDLTALASSSLKTRKGIAY